LWGCERLLLVVLQTLAQNKTLKVWQGDQESMRVCVLLLCGAADTGQNKTLMVWCSVQMQHRQVEM
jgi:hypothetical protein